MRISRFAAVAALSVAASAAVAQVQVNVVALQGQSLTGADGALVSALNNPSVNGLGQVGFTGTLNTGTSTTNFVFVNDKVKHRNDAVPGLTGAESQMGISNGGDFNFSPSLNSNDAVYTSSGVLLKETDPAPGLPGMNSVFNSRPYMVADGTAYWIGGVGPATATTQRVMFKATPAGGGTFTITPALAGGATIGADTITATGIEFPYTVSDNGAHTINRVTFSSGAANDAAVVVDGAIVAREGSIPSGGTAAWQAFKSVDVNNAGDHLVYGDDSSTVDDILVYNGVVAVRQGQVLGGETLGSTIDGAAINNLGDVVQLWDLPGTGNEGLFFGKASDLGSSALLLKVGNTIDTNGDTIADYTLTDFNASSTVSNPMDFGDNGVVYLDVDITPIGGTASVQAIIGVAVPEPMSAAFLLGAGLLGIRRRK